MNIPGYLSDGPAPFPNLPGRDISKLGNVEVVTKQFSIPNASVFDPVEGIVGLQKYHPSVEAYLALDAATNVNLGAVDLRANFLAHTGNIKVVAARSHQAFDTINPLRAVYLGGAHAAAEKWEVGINIGIAIGNYSGSVPVGAAITGTIALIGHDAPIALPNPMIRYTANGVVKSNFQPNSATIYLSTDLFSINAYQDSGGLLYLQFYDYNVDPVSTTTFAPYTEIAVPSGQPTHFSYDSLRPKTFSTGLAFGWSTTAGTFTQYGGSVTNFQCEVEIQ